MLMGMLLMKRMLLVLMPERLMLLMLLLVRRWWGMSMRRKSAKTNINAHPVYTLISIPSSRTSRVQSILSLSISKLCMPVRLVCVCLLVLMLLEALG